MQKIEQIVDKEVIDKCLICGKEIEDKCEIELCGHQFCFRCLYQWSNNSSNRDKNFCPICLRKFCLIRFQFQNQHQFQRNAIQSLPLYDMIRKKALKAENLFKQNVRQNGLDLEKKLKNLSEIMTKLDKISKSKTLYESINCDSIESIRHELSSISQIESIDQLDSYEEMDSHSILSQNSDILIPEVEENSGNDIELRFGAQVVNSPRRYRRTVLFLALFILMLVFILKIRKMNFEDIFNYLSDFLEKLFYA